MTVSKYCLEECDAIMSYLERNGGTAHLNPEAVGLGPREFRAGVSRLTWSNRIRLVPPRKERVYEVIR